MPATYKILLMGASYGSLLASKMLFGGHSIHLVCLPAEADLINAEGFKVRLPVRGRAEPVLLESRKLPGKVTAGGAAGVNPGDYDLVGLCMQEPQYRSPGVRELLDAVGKSRVPCMSIMNMPPLPYIKRIPGLDYKALEAAYTDPRVWDSVDPKKITLNSPDPQAIRPPDGKANELLVTLPTNFKCARFEDDKDTAIIRKLEKDVEAARFDAPEGKIELPVKLKVFELDLRAARQVVDAAGRQLSLHHQGRHAHRQGSGAHQHRGIALGLQFRVRPVREARRQSERPGAVREIRRRRAEPVAVRPPPRARCSTVRPISSAADKLVQLIAKQKGLSHPVIDANVALVDELLDKNRKKAAA